MTNDMQTDLSNCVEDDICVSDVPHIMDITNIKRCPIQLNDVCPCSCSVLIDQPIILQSIQSENIPDVCSHSLYRYVGKWKVHNPGSHKVGIGAAELIASNWAITVAHLAKGKKKHPEKKVTITFGVGVKSTC
eukprot:UN34662